MPPRSAPLVRIAYWIFVCPSHETRTLGQVVLEQAFKGDRIVSVHPSQLKGISSQPHTHLTGEVVVSGMKVRNYCSDVEDVLPAGEAV